MKHELEYLPLDIQKRKLKRNIALCKFMIGIGIPILAITILIIFLSLP